MVITCKLSLGFQKKEVLNLSARGVVHVHSIVHALFLMHFSSRNKAWTTSSLWIHANGIMRNASWRYVFGQNFQLYPTVLGQTITAVTRNEQLIFNHIDTISPTERQVLLSTPIEDIYQLVRYGRAWTLRKFGAWVIIWKYMNSVSNSLHNILLIHVL